MADNIALQLYSVRTLLPNDYEGVIRKVAAMGYKGVETSGFEGTTPAAAAQLFRILGLKVAAMHVSLSQMGDKFKEILDVLALLDCRTIVSGFGPDRFNSLDSTRKACDEFNQAAMLAQSHDIRFCVHNHWWEYLAVEGSYPYKVMLERLDTRIGFEVDTYWVKTGGCDPAAVVKEIGKRAPLLHIKDGPAIREKPQVAIGDGLLDFPKIIKAGQGSTEWLIVEFDSCATDILPAVEKSCQYLRGM
jgi:sugar phosphate isomerase/epimerase